MNTRITLTDLQQSVYVCVIFSSIPTVFSLCMVKVFIVHSIYSKGMYSQISHSHMHAI